LEALKGLFNFGKKDQKWSDATIPLKSHIILKRVVFVFFLWCT
jgi:hypothetical protein